MSVALLLPPLPRVASRAGWRGHVPVVEDLEDERCVCDGRDEVLQHHHLVARLLDRREDASSAAGKHEQDGDGRQLPSAAVAEVRPDLSHLREKGRTRRQQLTTAVAITETRRAQPRKSPHPQSRAQLS